MAPASGTGSATQTFSLTPMQLFVLHRVGRAVGQVTLHHLQQLGATRTHVHFVVRDNNSVECCLRSCKQVLSERQVTYAALDAWVGREIVIRVRLSPPL